MTPPATAGLMASMFVAGRDNIALLDPGAGVGSLTAAFVSEICGRSKKPKKLHVTAYEIDADLTQYLESTLVQCGRTCALAKIAFDYELVRDDFIEHGVRSLRQEMFVPVHRFNCAIMNPPYKKINSDSETRRALREIGVETSKCTQASCPLSCAYSRQGARWSP